MALYDAWQALVDELDVLSDHLRNFSAAKPALTSHNHFSLPDECLLEGLLSRVWQAWSKFCRTCVIDSCLGTVTAAGAAVPPLLDAVSEAHVSGACIRAKRGVTPPFGGPPNTVLRLEPTWGDVNVLVKIISGVEPANRNQLLAGFSAGHASAKALQLIRNGSAHNHAESMTDILALRSGYRVFQIRHPSHALYWVEPNSGDYLVTFAIQELKDSGFAAIT